MRLYHSTCSAGKQGIEGNGFGAHRGDAHNELPRSFFHDSQRWPMDGMCHGWWVIVDVTEADAQRLRELDEHGEWTQKYAIDWDELNEQHSPFTFECQSLPDHCGDPSIHS